MPARLHASLAASVHIASDPIVPCREQGDLVSSRSKDDVVASLYDAALGRRSWDEVGHGLVANLDGLTLMLSLHRQTNATVDVVSTLGMGSWGGGATLVWQGTSGKPSR
jgi:hypothetical protein